MDEITYSFQNFNSCIGDVWGWISNFIANLQWFSLLIKAAIKVYPCQPLTTETGGHPHHAIIGVPWLTDPILEHSHALSWLTARSLAGATSYHILRSAYKYSKDSKVSHIKTGYISPGIRAHLFPRSVVLKDTKLGFTFLNIAVRPT